VCAMLGDAIVSLGIALQDKDLDVIIDTAAEGIFYELDYRVESANADTFRDSMSFLGYVQVPRTLRDYSRGPRVLVTEWAQGRHLSSLSRAEGLRMTYMAVEAVTASIMVTGIVHADPHEGNIMLSDEGRLVFLDFGLMSTVEAQYMEAFAIGIQAVVNQDYDGLVDAFVKTRFVKMPLEFRQDPTCQWQEAFPEAMAADLRQRMESVPGGTSRFGALATVLIDMGTQWKFYSPPYVILLIRTFVTLEGIAGQVSYHPPHPLCPIDMHSH
jgi:predicted unusual protein kinase regulating ubiquinone biosynthesis (AarF/ABC1/UbiB family)